MSGGIVATATIFLEKVLCSIPNMFGIWLTHSSNRNILYADENVVQPFKHMQSKYTA